MYIHIYIYIRIYIHMTMIIPLSSMMALGQIPSFSHFWLDEAWPAGNFPRLDDDTPEGILMMFPLGRSSP